MLKQLFGLILCASLVPHLPGHDRKTKTPDVQVLDISVKREEKLLTIDARLKNTGRRPISGLTVVFRFEDGRGNVITTQRLQVDQAVLAPGEESGIEAQLRDAPQATQVQILSLTDSGAELSVGNSGPFMIE